MASPTNDKTARDKDNAASASVSNKNSGSLHHLGRSFCEETTAHGFGSFVRQNILLLKVCWGLIIAGAFIGSCWHLSLLVRSFLKYSSQDIVSVSNVAPVFPDVTICNNQPRSQSMWEELKDSTVVEDFETTVNNIKASASVAGTDWDRVQDRALSPVSFIENAGAENAMLTGHQLEDFIIYCRFAGSKCNPEDFSHHLHHTFYNCFTFRRNITVANETGSVGSGSDSALSLIVYLESKSALALTHSQVPQSMYNGHSHVFNGAGAKVVIHKQGSLPQPIEEGLDVAPGQSSSLAIVTEYRKRLHRPYGHCSDNDTLGGLSKFSYSTNGCMHVCMQRYIWQNCHCASAEGSMPDDFLGKPLCGKYNHSNPEQYFVNIACEGSRRKEFFSSGTLREQCNCYSPCKYYTYSVRSSGSLWPADEYVEDFYNYIVLGAGVKAAEELQTVSPTNTTHFAGFIRANFARINVYFKDLHVEEKVQKASYSMASLWADVGGTLGLWAGLSIITVTEIIVFLVKLLAACCFKLAGKQNRSEERTYC